MEMVIAAVIFGKSRKNLLCSLAITIQRHKLDSVSDV